MNGVSAVHATLNLEFDLALNHSLTIIANKTILAVLDKNY
jgi:hypothetical protein